MEATLGVEEKAMISAQGLAISQQHLEATQNICSRMELLASWWPTI